MNSYFRFIPLFASLLGFTNLHAERLTVEGVTIIRENVTNNQAGTTIGTLKVYFPAGFNVATDPFSRRAKPYAEFNNLFVGANDLPVTLSIDRQDIDPNAAAGPVYPLPDRAPIRFEANSITWNVAAGSFTFDAVQEIQYRDQLQLIALQVAINRGLPGAQAAASNSLYYLGAKDPGDPFEFRSRPGGAATFHSVSIDLDPYKFGPQAQSYQSHFPEMSISWNQATNSRIEFTNDLIDRNTSGLSGALPTIMTYARGIQPAGCEGEESPEIPTDDILCGPVNSRWNFTRDGGLHATCTLLQNLNFTGTTVEWMGYYDDDTLRFGHQITTRFETGNLMTGGVHIRNDSLNLPAERKLGALTHSGHSFISDPVGTERPGTNKYRNGLSDYPGLNLRCDDQVYNAQSRIAGQAVPAYPLEAASKYYLRPAGVTGLHLSSSNDPIELTALGGAEFELTALRLSFLDGENLFSGVDGSMHIPAPSNFTVEFEQLMFGPQGQLEGATIAPDQDGKILAAWSLQFDPLALDFPQPKSCNPPPGPGDGFPRLTSQATLAGLAGSSLIGPIGFYNGNILAESDPETGGNVPISRFATSANLSVNGPGNTKYDVTPMSGIAINKFQNGNWSPTISVGGLINLPFFVDLPVVMTSSSSNLGATPALAVRKPWTDLDQEDGFDLNHRGLPPGVNLSDYRNEGTHDPIVFRDWQDLIVFEFPVHLEADGYFRSRTPKAKDLFLFKFAQAVKSISPENAELIFDGNFNVSFQELVPQLNVASLLENSSLLDLNGGVDAILELDTILADSAEELLKPAIQQLVGSIINETLLDNLQNAGSPAEAEAFLNNAISQIEAQVPDLLDGEWKTGILVRLADIKTHLMGLKDALDTGAQISQLATQLVSALNNGSTDDLPDNTGLEETLAPVVALIDQVLDQITEIENALNGNILNDLLGSQLDDATDQIGEIIGEIDTEWTNSLVLAQATLADLENDLTCAITEKIVGTAFSATLGQIMRQYLGEPRDLIRQAIDDGIRKLELLIDDSIGTGVAEEALGGLSDFMAGGSLKGYARINGDSLQEIRIDGSTEISVTQDQKMKFDAWFLFRTLDSATPGTDIDENTECLKNAGVEAEIAMGAEADISWGTFNLGIAAAAKIALGDGGTPIGFTADFALRGQFEVGPVALQELKLGVGAGAGNGYFYGAATGEISLMSISAGIFIGRTCDPGVIANADPDIGAVLSKQGISMPAAGIVVYAEGGMSLMPIIGIPSSCFLDIRIHGGQGFIALLSGPANGADLEFTGGVKMLQGVSGELLCLVNIRGDFATVLIGKAKIEGSKIKFGPFSGSATATLKGKIGIGIFSINFKAKASLIITVDLSGNLKWKFDF